jgi:hypothetical protein
MRQSADTKFSTFQSMNPECRMQRADYDVSEIDELSVSLLSGVERCSYTAEEGGPGFK